MALHMFILFLIFVMPALSDVTLRPSTIDKKDKNLKALAEEDFSCPERFSSFCINGGCIFHKGLEIPICRCLSGFTGERCEHVVLPAYRHEYEATYIAIGLLVGLLISGTIAFIWFYRERKCKPRPEYGLCRENTP